MKKILKLTNEQAQSLYIIMSQAKNTDATKNRVRWKFLDVFEEYVFAYERALRNLQARLTEARLPKDMEMATQIENEIRELGLVTSEYIFNDREIFAQAKALFEISYDNLSGRLSRNYKELEDAFMEVKEVE